MIEEYINWNDYIGEKANIVEGNLVVDPQGFLTVSYSIAPYNLLIENNVATPLCPKTDFRGRAYRFMRSDCVTLVAEWYDTAIGTDFLTRLKTLFGRTYQQLNFSGYTEILESFGFVEQTTRNSETNFLIYQPQDLVFYEYTNHIGVCLDTTAILHHPNGKFSCIDQIIPEKVLKVYRYGN